MPIQLSETTVKNQVAENVDLMADIQKHTGLMKLDYGSAALMFKLTQSIQLESLQEEADDEIELTGEAHQRINRVNKKIDELAQAEIQLYEQTKQLNEQCDTLTFYEQQIKEQLLEVEKLQERLAVKVEAAKESNNESDIRACADIELELKAESDKLQGMSEFLEVIKNEQKEVQKEHKNERDHLYDNMVHDVNEVKSVSSATLADRLCEKLDGITSALTDIKDRFSSSIKSIVDKLSDLGAKLMQSKEALNGISSRLDGIQPQTDQTYDNNTSFSQSH